MDTARSSPGDAQTAIEPYARDAGQKFSRSRHGRRPLWFDRKTQLEFARTEPLLAIGVLSFDEPVPTGGRMEPAVEGTPPHDAEPHEVPLAQTSIS